MANVKAVIDVDINTSPAAQGLRTLQGQFNAFAQTLNTANASHARFSKEFGQQLAGLTNASQFFTAETVRMRTAASQLDMTLAKGSATMGQFFSARFRKDGLQAAQVLSLANARASSLQTQFIATGAAANGMREAIAIRPLQAFNSAAVVSAQKLAIHRAMLNQATTSMINFGKNTQWAGRQLMVGFTVPLTIFAGVAGKAFRELEKEAINFRKVYGDIFTTPAETEDALRGVQELTKEFTKYGVQAQKTMQLAAIAAQAGQTGADLMAATTQATRLAVLGNMENEDAMRSTIALQSSFKMSNEELSDSINFLNMVNNATVLSLKDVAESIPRVAPVIQGLGGDVKDLAVMMVAMREGGVSASEAANGLKSSLGRLITPSRQARDMAMSFGINLDQIVRKNAGDVLATVIELSEAMKGLADLERQQLLSTVFGRFQFARMGALIENITAEGSQAQRAMEMMAMSAADAAAVAERELGAIEESVATKFTAAMERMKLAIAPIGELFLKIAIPIVNMVAKIADAFNNLPDFAKNFLALGAAIVGVVIPAGTMFAGLLMNLIGTLVKVGHLIGLAFKGFFSGGLRGAIDNVSQALNYMSLEQLDATNSAAQLAGATGTANTAFREQVGAAGGARSAIDQLGLAYDLLRKKIERVTLEQRKAFGPGIAAMRGAGSGAAVVAGGTRFGRASATPGFNQGGSIPGVGNTDTVPAMLTPGEFVVNKNATKENLALLHAINDGKKMSGFNKGGQIPGVQYAMSGRLITTQQQLLDRYAALQGGRTDFGMRQSVRVGGMSRAEANYQRLMAQSVDSPTKNSRVVRFAVEQLGISPAELGLVSRGNFGFALSPASNSKMAKGILTRQDLLTDLMNPAALNPLSDQMARYFKMGIDRQKFSSFMEQNIRNLPVDLITNKRFEQVSRKALYQYLRSERIPPREAGNFMRDILQRTEISSGLPVSTLERALTERGISFRRGTGRKDYYVNYQGEQLNLGRLLGQEIGSLPKPSDIIRFTRQRDAKSVVPRGLVFAHANKGGMIPGLQHFAWNPIAGILNRQRVVQQGQRSSTFMHLVKGANTLSPKPNEITQVERIFGTRARPISGLGLDIDDGFLLNERMRTGKPTPVTMQELREAITKSKNPYKTLKMGGHSRKEIQRIKDAIFNDDVNQGGLASRTIVNDDFMDTYIRGAVGSDSQMLAGQGYRLSRGIGIKALRSVASDGRKVYREFLGGEGGGRPTRKVAVELDDGRIFSYETRNISTGGGVNQQGGQNFRVFATEAEYLNDVSSKGRYVTSWDGSKWQPIAMRNAGGIIPGGEVTPSRGLYGIAPRAVQMLRSYMAGNYDMMRSADTRRTIMGLARPVSGTFFRGTQIGGGALPKRIERAMLEAEKTGDYSKLVGQRFRMRASDWSTDKNTAARFVEMNEAKRKKDFLFYEKNIAERNIRKEQMRIEGFASGRSPWIKQADADKARESLEFWRKDLVRINRQLDEIGELSPLIMQARGTMRAVPASQLVPDATYLGRPITENNFISTQGSYEIRRASRGNLELIPVQRRNLGGLIHGYNAGGDVEAFVNKKIFESARKTIVPGVGNTDTVPAALTPGEFVVNKQSTRENLPLLRAINSGEPLAFNIGGMVPGLQYLRLGAMVNPISRLRALRSKMTDRGDIYFRRGMGREDPNDPFSTETMNIVAYQKRKFFRDKAVGSVTATNIPGRSRITRPDMQPTGQQLMFDPSVTGKPWTVGSFAVRPGYERVASQLLGLVARDTLARAGTLPRASANLSIHSSKIVEFLAKRGIIKDLRTDRTGFNEIRKRDARGMIKDAAYELRHSQQISRLSAKEVQQSSNFIRSILRSTRPSRANQSEQMLLFDQQRSVPPSIARSGSVSKLSPAEQIKQTQIEIQRLESILQAARSSRTTSSKQYGEIGTQLLAQINKANALSPINPADRTALDAIRRRASSMLEESGSMFNRTRAMGFNQGGVAGFNTGNIVPGVGNTDTVPAMLTPGEFVINKQATQQNLDLLHAINSGKVAGMNVGGIFKAYALGGIVDAGGGQYLVEGRNGRTFGPMSREDALRRSKQLTSARARRAMASGGSQGTGMMRGMGASMGMAMGGMGIMMLGQRMEQQAMERGETSGLGGLLSTGGIGLSMASILPFLPHAKIIAGFVALGGSMAALVAGANKLKSAFTETNKAMQGSADRAEKFAEAFGRPTNVQQLALARAQAVGGGITQESYDTAGQFMQSEAGKTLLSDLRLVQKIGKEQSEALVNQLKRSILAGAITTEEARSIAIQAGQALKNETLAITVSAELDKIFGPDGEKLERGRLGITSTLIPEFDIKELEKEADAALRTLGKVDWSRGFDLGAAGMTMITLGGTFITEGQKIRAMLNAMADQAKEAALIEKEARAAVTLEYQQGIITLEEYTSRLRTLFEMDISGAATTRYLEGVADVFSISEDRGNFLVGSIEGREVTITGEDIRQAPVRERLVVPETGLRRETGTSLELDMRAFSAEDYIGLSEEEVFQMSAPQLRNMAGSIESALAGFQFGGNLLTELASAQEAYDRAVGSAKDEAKEILDSKEKEVDIATQQLNMADKLLQIEKARSETVANLNKSTKSLLQESGMTPDQIERVEEIAGKVSGDAGLQTVAGAEIFQAFATGDFDANVIRLLVEMDEKGTLAGLIPDNIQDKVGFLKELGLQLNTFAAFPDLQEKMLNIIVNDPQNGREIVKGYEDTFIRLQRLPKDVISTFKIDMETPEGLDAAEEIIPGIERLMPTLDALDGEARTLAVGMSTDANGKPISLETMEKNVKKIFKVLEELESTDPVIRRRAMVQYMTMITDENGNRMDAEDAESVLQRLEGEFDPGTIRDLPTVVFKQVVQMETEIIGLEEAAAGYEALGVASINTQRGQELLQKAAEIRSRITALKERQRAAIKTAQPEKTGGAGGGGGGQKSIMQQLQEQFKNLKGFYDSLSKYINSKTGEFQGVIAGPFGPQFIEYLRSQGEEGLKVLKGSADKLKKVYQEFIKVQQQQTANFIQTLPANLLQQAGAAQGQAAILGRLAGQGIIGSGAETVLSGIDEGTQAAFASAAEKRRRNAERRRGERGGRRERLTAEEEAAFREIQGLLRGPTGAAQQELGLATASLEIQRQNIEFNELQKFASLNVPGEIAEQLLSMGIAAKTAVDKPKRFKDIVEGLEEVQKKQEMINITKAFEDMGKDIKGTMNIMAAVPGATQDVVDRLKGLGDMSKFSADEIRTLNTRLMMMEAAADAARPSLDRLGDTLDRALNAMQADIEKINRLEIRPLEMDISRIQKQMHPYQDEIKRLEKLIRPLNKEVEEFNDQINAKQKLIKPLNKDIEKLREEETELNKFYDERSKVLDRVSRANERYSEQQKGLFDVASALSRGDVGAAAQATIAMQQAMAQQRMDDAKSALEEEREKKRLELTEKIEAKEKEIKKINEEIDAIQESIEERQERITGYQRLIAEENEKIAEKQEKIEGIQRRIEESKERQLDLEERIYKSQLLQSMLATQRQISEDARLGRTEAVQFGINQLQAQMAVAGSNEEQRAKFFEGIPGGAEVLGAAGQMAAKSPEQIIAELRLNTEDLVTDVINNLREHLVDNLKMDLSEFSNQMPKPLFDLVNSLDEETGKFVGPDGVPYSFDQILQIFEDSDLKLEHFLGKGDNPGILGENIDQMIKSTRTAANNFLELPGLAASARKAFEGMVKALEGKIAAANAAAAAARAAANEARNAKPAASPMIPGRTFGGAIKRAFGGMIGFRGSKEPPPGMMYGGKLKKMAMGSWVPGIGMTDKVPALLTPGEFVVRKNVAQAYGNELSMLNSQIFPTLASARFGLPEAFRSDVFPKVDTQSAGVNVGMTRNSTVIGGSNIYYNYSIGVNAKTDANPDEIANAIMYKIKRNESRQVRGTRIG